MLHPNLSSTIFFSTFHFWYIKTVWSTVLTSGKKAHAFTLQSLKTFLTGMKQPCLLSTWGQPLEINFFYYNSCFTTNDRNLRLDLSQQPCFNTCERKLTSIFPQTMAIWHQVLSLNLCFTIHYSYLISYQVLPPHFLFHNL